MPVIMVKAQAGHVPAIRQMALEVWPETFEDILSAAQITYMLELMYNEAVLRKQLNELGHCFLLALDPATNTYLGFLSYEQPYQGLAQTKIHKIYVLTQAQGRGVGRLLMETAEGIARQQGDHCLLLNVNKHNKAEAFYKRLGFETIGTEDIDIGNGFLMEDKIMRKDLLPGQTP